MSKRIGSGGVLMLWCSLGGAYGCGAEAPSTIGDTQQEVVIDEANPHFQEVNAYKPYLGVSADFVKAHKDPVGELVAMGTWQRKGSGTLVGPNLFLTAGHCCRVVGKDGEGDCAAGTADWEQFAASRSVSFNYEHEGNAASELLPEDRYEVEAVVARERRSSSLDYMLLRLKGEPGTKYGWAKLQETPVAAGEKITIIGHPDGRAKQVSVGRITGTRTPWAGVPGWEDVVDPDLLHNADTLGGNSGSGMLSAKTGSLIGVHVAGSDSEHTNYGMSMVAILRHSDAVRALLKQAAPPKRQ